MQKFTLSGVDARLIKRYETMIIEACNSKEKLSAGAKAIPSKTSSFASTQATWRFYDNDEVSLFALQSPLLAAAQYGVDQHCQRYALSIHDWSRLAFKHKNKSDTYQMSHDTDIGYDLQSSLLINDEDGTPIAPAAMRLVSANGSYATYYPDDHSVPVKSHLDELCDAVESIEQQSFSKPLVHIVDRESDSALHMRHLAKNGRQFIFRVKAGNSLTFQGMSMKASAIGDQLTFSPSRIISYQGKQHRQEVAETIVTLTRPSTSNSTVMDIINNPVQLRLTVARVLSLDGTQVEAQWYLLSNLLDSEVDAATIALWYYWRWQIESFFKLLKSAGHHLESWQQESDLAIFKRLLVTSMACVTVWQIAAD